MDLDTMDFILRYMTPQPEDYRPLLDPLAAPGQPAARRASAPPDFCAVGTVLDHERAASAAGMAEETTTTGGGGSGGGIGGGDDLLGSRGQETGELAAAGQEQTSRGVLLSFEKQLGKWFASTELQPAPPRPGVDEQTQGMSHHPPRPPRAEQVRPQAEETLENRGKPPGGDEQPQGMSHLRPQRIRIRPELQARVDKAVEKWGDLYGRASEWDNNIVRRGPKPSRSVRRRRDGEGARRASDTGAQRTPSQAGGVVAPEHGGHSGDDEQRRRRS